LLLTHFEVGSYSLVGAKAHFIFSRSEFKRRVE